LEGKNHAKSSGGGVLFSLGLRLLFAGHSLAITKRMLEIKEEREILKTMKKAIWVHRVVAAMIALLLAGAASAWAQDKPADNMQILRDKIKADKKLLVATNMELTESEAKNFWPIYDDYQKDLQNINQRLGKLLESYAADYKNKTMTDEKAKKLVDEYVSIEQAEAKLKSSYVPKLMKALPATKVARYLQIENKIRAVIKYDLAASVPLVQ
jgi:hypothetical protein